MNDQKSPRGPLSLRLFLWILAGAFGLLVYWLLGFVIADVGTFPGPEMSQLEEEMLDPRLVETAETLNEQIADVDSQIADLQEQQQVLEKGTDSSQKTMNQLLEFQKLRIQKDIPLSDDEQQALADAQQQFLANQDEYQKLHERVATLKAERRDLNHQRTDNEEKLTEARRPVYEKFNKLQERHRLMMAAVKLLILVPLIIIAALITLKWRQSSYAKMIYAGDLALVMKVLIVMHDYFPSRYFKYVLILSMLAAVTWMLVLLIKRLSRPPRDWLMRQYREAYEAFHCPICEYPIRIGPLTFGYWTKRSLKKSSPLTSVADAKLVPYTCPACGTQLFEACAKCEGVRHSLLEYCSSCSDDQAGETVEQSAAAD